MKNVILFLMLILASVLNAQNAASSPTPSNKPVAFPLGIPVQSLKSGEYCTLPLTVLGTAPLIGWQMGLRFNPELLEFVAVSKGDLADIRPESFGLTKVAEGEIRALWIARLGDSEDHLRPGQVLFYLTFRARKAIADVSGAINIDQKIIPGEAYENDGKTIYRLSMRGMTSGAENAAPGSMQVLCHPNPANSQFLLDFELKSPEAVNLMVYDDFGKLVLNKTLELPAGVQTIQVPEIAHWAAAVYHWELKIGKTGHAQGHVIKL
ncbi:MAG: hypothetical protein KGS48_16085 [Bacteroidetes bacterium]|nr:hypothetical protein [Bacteroidota bacterium]